MSIEQTRTALNQLLTSNNSSESISYSGFQKMREELDSIPADLTDESIYQKMMAMQKSELSHVHPSLIVALLITKGPLFNSSEHSPESIEKSYRDFIEIRYSFTQWISTKKMWKMILKMSNWDNIYSIFLFDLFINLIRYESVPNDYNIIAQQLSLKQETVAAKILFFILIIYSKNFEQSKHYPKLLAGLKKIAATPGHQFYEMAIKALAELAQRFVLSNNSMENAQEYIDYLQHRIHKNDHLTLLFQAMTYFMSEDQKKALPGVAINDREQSYRILCQVAETSPPSIRFCAVRQLLKLNLSEDLAQVKKWAESCRTAGLWAALQQLIIINYQQFLREEDSETRAQLVDSVKRYLQDYLLKQELQRTPINEKLTQATVNIFLIMYALNQLYSSNPKIELIITQWEKYAVSKNKERAIQLITTVRNHLARNSAVFLANADVLSQLEQSMYAVHFPKSSNRINAVNPVSNQLRAFALAQSSYREFSKQRSEKQISLSDEQLWEFIIDNRDKISNSTELLINLLVNLFAYRENPLPFHNKIISFLKELRTDNSLHNTVALLIEFNLPEAERNQNKIEQAVERIQAKTNRSQFDNIGLLFHTIRVNHARHALSDKINHPVYKLLMGEHWQKQGCKDKVAPAWKRAADNGNCRGQFLYAQWLYDNLQQYVYRARILKRAKEYCQDAINQGDVDARVLMIKISLEKIDISNTTEGDKVRQYCQQVASIMELPLENHPYLANISQILLEKSLPLLCLLSSDAAQSAALELTQLLQFLNQTQPFIEQAVFNSLMKKIPDSSTAFEPWLRQPPACSETDSNNPAQKRVNPVAGSKRPVREQEQTEKSVDIFGITFWSTTESSQPQQTNAGQAEKRHCRR